MWVLLLDVELSFLLIAPLVNIPLQVNNEIKDEDVFKVGQRCGDFSGQSFDIVEMSKWTGWIEG